MGYITTISCSEEFIKLAKENHISWTEASRVGMAILLAERGIKEYDNKLNLYRKMRVYQQQAEEALQRISELEKGNKSLEEKHG